MIFFFDISQKGSINTFFSHPITALRSKIKDIKDTTMKATLNGMAAVLQTN